MYQETPPTNNNHEIGRLASAVESLVKQEKWTRRFSNLLKLAIALYVIFFIFFAMEGIGSAQEEMTHTQKAHTAVVRLEGPIMPGSMVSAESLTPLLKRAFKNPASKAVIIKANSPGGSPVQSALINDEITRLKKLYNKPVYVVVEDICASGCYYIAAAADKIYANKGSLIGSIGVRMDSFGLTGLMEKLGVENRSMTAGEHKTFIDPFSPVDEEGRQFFKQKVLERTHQQFIASVREGRGDRIKETEQTYSGLVWLGDESVENGLIDGLGDLGYVARDVIAQENLHYYEVEKPLMQQLLGDIGAQAASSIYLNMTGLR